MPPGEVRPGEHPRQRESEDERERGCTNRADQREPESIADDGVGQIGEQLGPRRALEEPDQREDEEGDGERGEDGDGYRWPPFSPSQGGRNPNFLRVFCPSFDATYCTHALAAVAF